MSALEQAQRFAWRLYHVDANSMATDIGLLILRVLIGACLIYHHGAEKFYSFHELLTHPVMDPIGIGVVPSTIFAGFADGVCSLLVLLGLFSRYAAFFSLICLNTVWWIIDHGMQRLLGLPIPAPVRPAPAAGQAMQHAAQLGVQHAPDAAPHIARVVHSLPNYLNVPMYILGFLVIFIAGPGRYSLDRLLEAKMRKKAVAIAGAPAD